MATTSEYYVPILVDPVNGLVIQTPIPQWSGLNYAAFRYPMGFTSNAIPARTSKCGEVDVDYFVANYAFRLEGDLLQIQGFGVTNNAPAKFYTLMTDVLGFSYQFGIVNDTNTSNVEQYVNDYSAIEDGRRIRTVKYTITVGDQNVPDNQFTLTKVVRLHNPIVIRDL